MLILAVHRCCSWLRSVLSPANLHLNLIYIVRRYSICLYFPFHSVSLFNDLRLGCKTRNVYWTDLPFLLELKLLPQTGSETSRRREARGSLYTLRVMWSISEIVWKFSCFLKIPNTPSSEFINTAIRAFCLQISFLCDWTASPLQTLIVSSALWPQSLYCLSSFQFQDHSQYLLSHCCLLQRMTSPTWLFHIYDC